MKNILLTALIIGSISGVVCANDAVVLTPQVAASTHATNSQAWQPAGVQPKMNEVKQDGSLDNQQLKQFSQKIKELSSRINAELEQLIDERFHMEQ